MNGITTILDQIADRLESPTIADNFAGGGGLSKGTVTACTRYGLTPQTGLSLYALNHDLDSVRTHATNFPWAHHIHDAIENVEPAEVLQGKKLLMLVGSPPCFPAGTLILTQRGMVPIESVQRGDLVLTHKNRWRRVTRTMNRVARATIKLVGQGHYGLETTHEHPFYAREKMRLWNNDRRSTESAFTGPEWVDARDMKGKYWARPQAIPAVKVPAINGRGLLLSETLFYLIGLWLAEGSVTQARGIVRFHVGKHEADEIEEFFESFAPQDSKRSTYNEMRFTRLEKRTTTEFQTAHRGFAEWLVENFGKGAAGKTLPVWIYGVPVEWRKALLNGWRDGDGWQGQDTDIQVTTTSHALAVSMATLASTLGYQVSVHRHDRRATTIEGRPIAPTHQLSIRWREAPQRTHGIADGRHTWLKVHKVLPGRRNVWV